MCVRNRLKLKKHRTIREEEKLTIFLIASQRSVDFNRKFPPRVDKMFIIRAFIAQLSGVR